MNELMMQLEKIKERDAEVTVYILNGYQCKGKIVRYSPECIVMVNSNNEKESLILMHAISTIEH